MLGEMTDIDYRVRLGYGYDNPEWLRCPSSYVDVKTHVINKLIQGLYGDDILSKNSTLRRLYLIRNYHTRYTIVFEFELNTEYRNNDILTWILITTVDKILEWWDITKRNNLDVEYITRGRRPINQNYYQVMWESFTNKSRFRGMNSDGINENHPRFQDMCRWMYNHNPREYGGHMNRYDPYRYQPNPQQELLQQYHGRGIGQLDHPSYEQFQQRGGIQQGYYDYNIMGGQRQQQIIIPLEEIERIETGRIKKMLNKIKIKW
jgi:hypothetical protein